jgi:Fic/DOC family
MNARTQGKIINFIRESNHIEGIHREPTAEEVTAHDILFNQKRMTLEALLNFVHIVQPGAELRNCLGMNVRVGDHYPPPGGSNISFKLQELLDDINTDQCSPYFAHCRYETIHPFMDCNGRSGRAVWAWQHLQRGMIDPFGLGFLHRFYYEALGASRT